MEMMNARSADAPTIGAMSWPRLPPAAGPDRRHALDMQSAAQCDHGAGG
jgi:hypothetical protein